MKCQQRFLELYKREAEALAFCPYRVCPIGAHSDHNLGKINGFAIDKGIHIAYSPKLNGVVELCSLQFDKRAQWHVRDVPRAKCGDWADYLRGATLKLAEHYPLTYGISGVIEGSLPIGGLSSSAAVVLVYLKALCHVNLIHPEPHELIAMSVAAENEYVGVNSGKLDQSCEMYSRAGHLLYLDTKDDTFELIPSHPDMKPWKIAIFFSGVERTLAGSKFNMRVDEARSAAYALMAYAGMDYGKFHEANLRDVPREVYDMYRDRLPEPWAKRAEHWFTEFSRVEAGAEAWRRGDIEAYGRLSTESGHSSIYNWQTGSPELKALYEIAIHTDGVYGGRFSGAGFKGCCMALIDPAYEATIRQQVAAAYTRQFPALRDRFSIHICDSSNGIS